MRASRGNVARSGLVSRTRGCGAHHCEDGVIMEAAEGDGQPRGAGLCALVRLSPPAGDTGRRGPLAHIRSLILWQRIDPDDKRRYISPMTNTARDLVCFASSFRQDGSRGGAESPNITHATVDGVRTLCGRAGWMTSEGWHEMGPDCDLCRRALARHAAATIEAETRLGNAKYCMNTAKTARGEAYWERVAQRWLDRLNDLEGRGDAAQSDR